MYDTLSIRIDESAWPIITLHVPAALNVADADAYTSAFEAAMARGAPFGVVLLPGPAYLNGAHDPLVANRTMKWLKQHKSAFSACCVGMALVIADPAVREAFASQSAALGEKIYGCAVGVFAAEEAAQTWLRTQLAAVEEQRKSL